MDVKAFRSPLTTPAMALWVGCLQWPLTIPVALALPLIYRRHKARTNAFSFMLLFALGWTARAAQNAMNPFFLSPKRLAGHVQKISVIAQANRHFYARMKRDTYTPL